MNQKILLSSYIVKISDTNHEPHQLSRIDGSKDFIDVFEKYANQILANIEANLSADGQTNTHLTLENPINTSLKTSRSLYGLFSSGVGGEKYNVVDTVKNETALEVEPHHAAFRNIFFYLHVPRLKNNGYLILQRKSNFGIKTRIAKSLNKFIISEGFNGFNLQLNNILHTNVYYKMMEYGNLKKVDLIKHKIPESLEDYINNGQEYNQIKGTLKTSFSSRSTLPDSWKKWIDNHYKPKRTQNDSVEIEGLDNDYSDVEFELELNGKRKTYYMVNQHKTQPDIDVTANIEMVDGEATIESLIIQAKEIIDDIIQNPPR